MAYESPALTSPLASALNHLLEAELWARERLAPFAGDVLEIRAAPLPPLRLSIAADGRLVPPGPGTDRPAAEPSLVVTLRPELLAAAVRGEDHLLRSIDVAGNAKLAAEVMFLARHLRPDVEEVAAKLVGDAAAHRLAGMGRNAAAWLAVAARRISASLVEYAVEEKQLLVKRAELEEIAAAHALLRDGLERIDKRIRRLAGGR
jgi:ubiquinone biosynthesis protein UbiJ